MLRDSPALFAPFGAPSENYEKRDDDKEQTLERRHETTNLKELPRRLLTALACARALLDQLELVIDAENDERTHDVVIQVADHLKGLASTMTLWQADT